MNQKQLPPNWFRSRKKLLPLKLRRRDRLQLRRKLKPRNFLQRHKLEKNVRKLSPKNCMLKKRLNPRRLL